MTVWIYVDTSKQVSDKDHLKVFASADAADAWFADHDPEGVAFEYAVMEEAVTEAALLLRLKRRDHSRFLPKLYRMTVHKLLCALFGIVVAFAKKGYPVHDVTVFANDVGVIAGGHDAPPRLWAGAQHSQSPM